MKYRNNNYEDEIDRMRARQKNGRTRTSQKREKDFDDFEIIEDLDELENHREGRKRSSVSGHGSSNNHWCAKKPKRRKKKKWLRLVLLLSVLLIGFGIWKHSKTSGYWTIVVYGVDSRDGNLGKGALADVQILCSINRKTGEIRLASVFRDTYLKIDPEGNYNKINEAYFLGGREQAGEALKENLDLHIEDYATFNWKAVVDAINILGGIDLEITDKEFAYINSFITETVNSTGVGSVQLEHSGMNHLDGVQAVAYSRLRLMDTDFNRTERQRKVLGLAMEKAKQADFNTLRILVGTVFPQISTSIGVDDLMIVAKDIKKYYIGQTSGFPFSHSEMKIGKKDCVIPTTLESNVVQLHSFLYDDTQFVPSGVVKNISARIAEVSGLGSPGKDTESGKNVGAEGNTGNQQNPPEAINPTDSAPAEAAPPTDNENQPEQPPKQDEAENPSSQEVTVSVEETSAGESQEENEEENEGSQPPSNAPEPTVPDNTETDSANGSLAAPGGSQTSPGGTDGPGGGNGPSENQGDSPNAFLEAPGQEHSPATGPVAGPGN